MENKQTVVMIPNFQILTDNPSVIKKINSEEK